MKELKDKIHSSIATGLGIVCATLAIFAPTQSGLTQPGRSCMPSSDGSTQYCSEGYKTAYFTYGRAGFWYRDSAGGYCGITSPTHLKVLQITDPAPDIGYAYTITSEFGRDLGVCPPYAFYFNSGGGVNHFSSNRGGYCAFTTPQHLQRFQQSNPAISLGYQTPQLHIGRNFGVCP